jgi:L-asparagine permease
MIVLCQMQLQRLAGRGELLRPSFRMPGSPVTGWLTLAFLLAVLVLMAFDSPVGTWTIASLLVIIPLLMLGWRLCRHRILELAAVRDGFTGPYPLVANRPTRGAGGDES